MSANIQFMETGNLLSPDKGDMSGFFDHPVCRRLVAGSGGQRRTCHLRAGVVADRNLNGGILPRGQVSCVQAA